MWIIFRKEINSFFNSFVGYIAILSFITALGILLWLYPGTNILYSEEASLQTMFNIAPYLLLILCPAITMGLWSSEKKSGMIVLLLTMPLKTIEIILGKYFASLIVILFSISLTLIYYISIYFLGNPVGNIDTASVIGSYFGLILLSFSFTAISLFSSSLSENQFVCFVFSIILCSINFLAFDVISRIEVLQTISTSLTKFGSSFHYYSLGRGVIDSRDIYYFVLVILISIYCTKLVLDRKR